MRHVPALTALLIGTVVSSVVLARVPQDSQAAASAQSATETPAATSTAQTEPSPPKMVCRNEKVTGSTFRTRKVCSTPESEKGSQDWVREQQQRGAMGASAILNSSGGQ